MTDGKAKAAEPSPFQGLASSPAREATRRATRRFCKLLQPARERENRPVYLDFSFVSRGDAIPIGAHLNHVRDVLRMRTGVAPVTHLIRAPPLFSVSDSVCVCVYMG